VHRQDAKSAKEQGAGLRPDEAPASLPAVSWTEPRRELDELAEAVIGAAIEVHRHLGPGYLEGAYEQALAIELRLRGIEFERQVPIPLSYKGYEIGEGRVDFLVRKELVVELKAVESTLPVHKTQVISYLKALSLHLGLLINFNVRVLKEGIRRVVRS
jgi:GxxExxY protein